VLSGSNCTQRNTAINSRILQQILVFAQECLRQSARYAKLTVPEYAATLTQAASAPDNTALTTFQALIETAFEVTRSLHPSLVCGLGF
jgi:hypothetical protein